MEIASLNTEKPNINLRANQELAQKQTNTASLKVKRPQKSENTELNLQLPVDIAKEIANSIGIDLSGAHIAFSKDKDTKEIVIKVVDNETHEVIKQIPPEEVVALRKRMNDIQGLLMDRKV